MDLSASTEGQIVKEVLPLRSKLEQGLVEVKVAHDTTTKKPTSTTGTVPLDSKTIRRAKMIDGPYSGTAPVACRVTTGLEVVEGAQGEAIVEG